MGNPVMHFEVIAADPERLRRFYGQLFGWREERYPDADYTILRSDSGQGIDLAVGSIGNGLSAEPTPYIAVDDVDGFVQRAKELGAGEIIQAPYDVECTGRFAVIVDPEGNRVGLWTMPGTRS